MLAIRKIQHPKPRVDLDSHCLAARGAVEVPFSQLRFAIGTQIAISPVVFQNINRGDTNAKRLGQLLRLDEVEIVSRGVILRKSPPHTPHQTADWEIETGRTVLSLVVPIGRELQNLVRLTEVA